LNKKVFITTILLGLLTFAYACRDRTSGKDFTIGLVGKFSTLDPVGAATISANDERLRTLMFNSLVRKNDQFDYEGELADISQNEDGSTIIFKLKDGVKFHDGKTLTSADAKYTFDKLFESNGAKGSAFFDTVDGAKKPHILGIETPDEKTVNIKLARPSLKSQLLANLVPIAIIQNGSEVGTQASNIKPPIGTGAYKFISFDPVQNILMVEAFEEYWEGAPNIKKITVKALADANAVQAELKSQIIDIAPGASDIAPDALKSLEQDPNLSVLQFDGSNIQYLGFNTDVEPTKEVKVRQAVAYAVNREKIISDLLFNQAKIAHSILPPESWAYNAGTKYNYDPAKAKQLLDEAGFKDNNGDGTREMPKITFKISQGASSQYATLIQSQLAEIGIPVQLESLEFATMLDQVKNGQFQMNTGRWVGGNQDPLFLRNLFASSEIPIEGRSGFNRGRYSNPQVDELLNNAFNETDREKAKEYYFKAQEIVSNEVPMLPLWYSANMVVANKRVKDIKVNASGDWGFVKNLTVSDNK
jgi:peptide/nickel transport system substrate-binding protein